MGQKVDWGLGHGPRKAIGVVGNLGTWFNTKRRGEIVRFELKPDLDVVTQELCRPR